MNDKENPSSSDPDDTLGAMVDEVCDKFEAAWQSGKQPRMEDYLDLVPPDKCDVLLSELLSIEISYRIQKREQPAMREYMDRFPRQQDLVRRVFKRLDATERSEATQPVDDRTERVGQVISASTRYSELKFHDEGGLGEVFFGKDEELRRHVAIKFIHREHVAKQELLERFRIEGEVTSRLDHPGVVPVYAMGEGWDGRPFYVMRFIEGDNLGTAIEEFWKQDWSDRRESEWRMDLHRLLGHLIAACNTVAYAHNRGVLHRDIKPANIMLGKYGETLVVDWGLAQFIARDERAKASGEETLMPGEALQDSQGGAGTIGYISPEQLPGSAEPIGKACDVYSLGATLYKLLTGVTAFHRNQGRSVWNRIREGDFRKPRELNKNCPPALEAICLKAMANRPIERYSSALELAEDLRRWMADETVTIYREPLSGRIMRCARRHREWSFAGMGIAALTLVMTSALAVTFHYTNQQTQAAVKIAEEANQENLTLSAAVAGGYYGNDIDRRWRILTTLAADQSLDDLILEAKGKEIYSPEFNALNQWLLQRIGELDRCINYDTWFVTDDEGRQLARSRTSTTVGQSFRNRPYFHGGPRILDDEEASDARPIEQPCLSAVYRSQSTGQLKVAFSAPVWGTDQQGGRAPIGVLGMSVVIDELNQFETKTDKIAIGLIDLREDWLEDKPAQGLILDHPSLEDVAKREQSDFLRANDELVHELSALRKARRTNQNGWKIRPITLLGITSDAACEPIFVPGRQGDLRDTGWVVVVQDLRAAKSSHTSATTPDP